MLKVSWFKDQLIQTLYVVPINKIKVHIIIIYVLYLESSAAVYLIYLQPNILVTRLIIQIYIYIYTRTSIYIYIRTYIYTHTYIYIHTHIYKYIYIHTYILYTYAHTHTHIYIYISTHIFIWIILLTEKYYFGGGWFILPWWRPEGFTEENNTELSQRSKETSFTLLLKVPRRSPAESLLL